MDEEVRGRWEETATYFQDEANVAIGVDFTGYMADGAVDDPSLGLLDDCAGADAVELGCGGGQLTVGLARRGADVVGVDFSREQLRFAEATLDAADVEAPVLLGDVENLPLADESFDLATNAFVFQWVGDLPAAFAEAFRVLRPGGRFVFATPHPAFDVVDPETGELTGSYFDTGRQVVPDPSLDHDLVTYRSTVGELLTDLVDAGFELERVVEPGSPDPEDWEPGPWGEHPPALSSKLPSLLVVAARRPEPGNSTD